MLRIGAAMGSVERMRDCDVTARDRNSLNQVLWALPLTRPEGSERSNC